MQVKIPALDFVCALAQTLDGSLGTLNHRHREPEAGLD